MRPSYRHSKAMILSSFPHSTPINFLTIPPLPTSWHYLFIFITQVWLKMPICIWCGTLHGAPYVYGAGRLCLQRQRRHSYVLSHPLLKNLGGWQLLGDRESRCVQGLRLCVCWGKTMPCIAQTDLKFSNSLLFSRGWPWILHCSYLPSAGITGGSPPPPVQAPQFFHGQWWGDLYLSSC